MWTIRELSLLFSEFLCAWFLDGTPFLEINFWFIVKFLVSPKWYVPRTKKSKWSFLVDFCLLDLSELANKNFTRLNVRHTSPIVRKMSDYKLEFKICALEFTSASSFLGTILPPVVITNIV